MVERAQWGSCIPYLHRLLHVLLLLVFLFGEAEAIRIPRRRLHQLSKSLYPGSLACGNTFTCGLQSSGKAFCWGRDNNNGQLGTNATTGSIAPAPVAGNGVYTKISAGYATACGIQNDLTGYCWGLNDQGQAAAINETQPVDSSLFAPTQIFGNDTWLEIDVGRSFGCGINTNRTLYCWGTSYSGALGNSQAVSTALVPQAVIGDSVKWNKVACGFDFTCAITTEGLLYCFGSNQFGQTGIGTSNKDDVLVPTLVPTPSSTNNPQNDSNGTTNNSEIANTSTWVDVFIGSNSQFAFATLSDGTSWSWGSGIEGQLATLEINVAFSPQRMLTVQSWDYIAGGTAQVLGVSTAGGGYAWGTGPLGQLGAGLAINATVGPIKISTPDQLDEQTGIWSDMCANEEQSCGIYNGALYCWGSAATELLGSPGGDTSFPRQVQGKGTWGVTPFSPPPAPLPPPLSPPPQPSPPHKNPKPPPPPPVKPPKSTGASVGEIIGAAVGGVVFASLILLGLLLWRRKVDQKRKALKNSIIDNGDEKPDAVLLWAAHSQEIESPRAALTRLIPPTLSPLEFDWSEVQVLKPLGAGSFGAVYLANIHHTKMAVKVLVDADAVVAAAAASTQPLSQKSGIDESNSSTAATDLNDISSISSTFVVSTTPSVPKAPIEKMLQEASLMATLQHPNVVHLLGFCISPPCMAVEYCPRGSLDDVLAQGLADSESAKRLTWIRRLRMAKDIAAGLLHLHSRVPPILHRDVKSPNMLVTADYTVKVADMGLSKLAEEVQGGMRNRSTMGGGGNPRWLAPEILNGKNASKESDVFSFAMVQLELLTWQLPWNEENFWSVSSAVQRGERPTIPSFGQLPGFDKAMTSAQKESVSKYIELMTRCWAQDPVQRPDMSVVADELEKLCREHGAKSKN